MKDHKWKEGLPKLGQRLEKFKYPILILLLGLVILAIPTKKAKTAPPETAEEIPTEDSAPVTALEARLEAILSQIDGAGEVRVLLCCAAGEKQVYQTDSHQEIRPKETGQETSTDVETVLVSKGSGTELPVVVQTIGPTYQGALIVCEGADSAQVQLNMVNAVSSLTGLGADKITVMKMKASRRNTE